VVKGHPRASEPKDRENKQMHAKRKSRRSDLMLAMVTVIVAVLGTAGILISDFGPGNDSHRGSNARMVTAAAVARAGAIEIPSERPAGNLSAVSRLFHSH
jgi:hypothetical protein